MIFSALFSLKRKKWWIFYSPRKCTGQNINIKIVIKTTSYNTSTKLRKFNTCWTFPVEIHSFDTMTTLCIGRAIKYELKKEYGVNEDWICQYFVPEIVEKL